jgi:signal transduction histidine kinase
MLYQSFLNILINAMQAMPDGGSIGVEISANNQIVTIHFDDEGQGIPAETLEKIWDPFFTTKEKGTGLGLGIVKNIIESHGGSIQVLNRPQGGARVTVELPVQHPPIAAGSNSSEISGGRSMQIIHN